MGGRRGYRYYDDSVGYDTIVWACRLRTLAACLKEGAKLMLAHAKGYDKGWEDAMTKAHWASWDIS